MVWAHREKKKHYGTTCYIIRQKRREAKEWKRRGSVHKNETSRIECLASTVVRLFFIEPFFLIWIFLEV